MREGKLLSKFHFVGVWVWCGGQRDIRDWSEILAEDNKEPKSTSVSLNVMCNHGNLGGRSSKLSTRTSDSSPSSFIQLANREEIRPTTANSPLIKH